MRGKSSVRTVKDAQIVNKPCLWFLAIQAEAPVWVQKLQLCEDFKDLKLEECNCLGQQTRLTFLLLFFALPRFCSCVRHCTRPSPSHAAKQPVLKSKGIVSGSRETMEHKQEAETSSGFSYKHHYETGLHIHEISLRKSRSRVVLSYIGILFLLINVCKSLLAKDLSLGSAWNITFAILVAKCLQYKPVKKESVVIMPSFGVQLEIHFWSGRVDRRFVPIGKILKPVLNECVTPVTCYWSLALLLRDEEELLLVFQKFCPPVKLLVPVWKALCTLSTSECPGPSGAQKPNSAGHE